MHIKKKEENKPAEDKTKRNYHIDKWFYFSQSRQRRRSSFIYRRLYKPDLDVDLRII